MNVVATRYLGLVPTIKGFEKNLGRELGGKSFTGMGDKAGRGLGSRLASGMGGVLKKSLVGVGVAAGGVLTASIVKGFGRLSAIENAEAKLIGLGNSASATSAIMDNALAAVKGTAFGMDEAATTAASAVAAGIKPGKELEGYLRLVGDAATIAGVDMASMGSIFNKVATSGKVQGDVFAQLGDMGIPIVQLLAEEMGISADQVYKLGSEGKISSDKFLAAMSSMSGAALEGGKTTSGAFKNMGAALSRFGATLLKGVYPLIGPFFNQITNLIDGAAEAVTPFLDAIAPKLEASAQKVLGWSSLFTESLGGIIEVFRSGDFDPSKWAEGIEEDSALVDWTFRIRDGFLAVRDAISNVNWGAITGFLGPIVSGFSALVPVLAQAWANLSPLGLVFDILAPVLPQIGQAVGQLAQVLAAVLGSALQAVLPAVTQLVGALGPLVAQLLASVIPAVLSVATAFGAAMVPVIQSVGPLLTTVVGSLVPVLQQVVNAVGPVVTTLSNALGPVLVGVGVAIGAIVRVLTPVIGLLVRFSPIILGVVGAVMAGVKVFQLYQATVALAAAMNTTFLGAINAMTLGVIRQRIATVASTAAQKAMAVWTKVVTAAQWAWNAAVNANPIGLVVIAIAALVAGLVLFFTKTEKGREIWETVWGAIKGAAQAVVSWFTDTAWPALQAAWNGVGAGVMWLYHNAILPAWNGIKVAIAAVGDWVVDTLWPAMQTAWQAIGAAAMWLWNNVMQPVWTGIKTVIAVAVTAILLYIDLLKWYYTNVIAPAAMWLWNSVMKPAWDGIKAVIGAVVAWFRDVAWPALKAAWDALAAAARWLYGSVILPVWNAIKVAIAVVINWFTNTAWPAMKSVIDFIAGAFRWLYNNVVLPVWNAIKGAINAVINWIKTVGWPALQLVIKWMGDAFKWLYHNVVLPVWNAIKGAINAVVQWFKNTAWPLINTVIGWLKMSFEGWKLIAKAVWQAIKDAIKAVGDWFKNTLWPLVRSVIESLKTGFNNMRDSIKNAWNFIKDRVINPVATWFRDTIQPLFKRVTDGIKESFNKLKDAIKKAWEGIRDTAKAPIKFLIETIVRDNIIKKYNEVANGVFGLNKVDEGKFTVGWRRGGILPGYTPMHKGDDVLTPMRSGEGVLVSEGLRDERSRRLFLQANEAAKRGASFASFMERGYAGGGLVKLRSPFRGSYRRGDGFGARGGRHKGIDWPIPAGTALLAVAAGTAKHTRNAAAGNKLNLNIGNGLVAGYHHLSRFGVSSGASVNAGQTVGYVGSTGRSSGPHLHFSLKKDGRYVDPAPYLGAGGAAGSGDGGDSGWNPFEGIWDSIKTKVREGVGDTRWGDMLFEMPKKVLGGAVEWAAKKLGEIGDWAGEKVDQGVGYARYAPVATQALMRENQYGPRRFKALMRRMGQESGYDPNAVNNWDSNAKKGTPSKGLMQLIGPTFNAYRDKSLSSNIFDPLANIVASIRYTLARYGDLEKGWNRRGGYAMGGIIPTLYDRGGRVPPGLNIIANKTNRPETMLPPEESAALTTIAKRGTAGGVEKHYHYSPNQLDLTEEIGRRTRREFEEMMHAAEQEMAS